MVTDDLAEQIAEGVAERRHEIDAILSHRRTDSELFEAGCEALSAIDGSATAEDEPVSPLGAATVAVLLCETGWRAEVSTLVDLWVTSRGMAFAAQATLELGNLWVRQSETGTCVLQANRGGFPQGLPVVLRMRQHVADADETVTAGVIAALAAHTSPTDPQRVLRAYLVPTKEKWVNQAIEVARQSRGLSALAGSSKPEDLPETWTNVLGPMIDGIVPAVAKRIASWFDAEEYLPRRIDMATALALMPTDNAFQALVDRVGHQGVATLVAEAIERDPIRAIRLLGEQVAKGMSGSGLVEELLRTVVLGQPEAAHDAGLHLGAPARQVVDDIRAARQVEVVADPLSLPSVLVDPPWASTRPRRAPAVVEIAEAPIAEAVRWEPGEQERWTNGYDPSNPCGDGRYWARHPGKFDPARYDWGLFIAFAPIEQGERGLTEWRPCRSDHGDLLRRIAGRHGAAALGVIERAIEENASANAELLLPFESTDVARTMLRWSTMSSRRGLARQWFQRHPQAGATVAIPAALGKAGPARRNGEAALRVIAGQGRKTVLAVAVTYGDEAADAITDLLDTDPLEVLPRSIPTLVSWADPPTLPALVLGDRATVLPAAAVEHALVMMAMSTAEDRYAGLDTLAEVADPQSLAAFVWSLFLRWQVAGYPKEQAWVLTAQGWFGDDETAARLDPYIRAWPFESGHKRAVAGLDVLASIGTDAAIAHLHDISQRTKARALKQRAIERIADVAEGLGLTGEMLADRLVPDLGLAGDGTLIVDYGSRQFVISFDERLRPTVADADGLPRKSLPKPTANDPLGKAAHKGYAALTKQARTLAGPQLARLEGAMVGQRRWNIDDYARLLVEHPLLGTLVRRLVWASFGNDGQVLATFRVTETHAVVDVDEAEVDAGAGGGLIGLAHPVQLLHDLDRWTEVFARHEIVQPFAQLDRGTYAFTNEERAATKLHRFDGAIVPSGRVLGLERHGWERGQPEDNGDRMRMERQLPHGGLLLLHLYPGINASDLGYFPEQTLRPLGIIEGASNLYGYSNTTFGELDPITASEVLRDLTTLTAP